MTDYRKELEALRERIAKRRETLRLLEQLEEQEASCRQKLSDLQTQYVKEQEDVERLRHISWSSLWAAAKGSLEEDLEREQAEAFAAQARVQETQRHLGEIRSEIEACRAKADESCEAEYQELLQKKEAEYRRTNPDFAARMAELERRELAAATERRELNEALCAGKRLLTQMAAALESLSSAEGWSTWDLFGGGMMSDMMKYSRLDEAQKMMEAVQSDLRRYRAELADVTQGTCLELQMDQFTWVMDIWFDNVFADWMVRDRIIQASNRLEEVQQRVQQTQWQLESRLEDVQQRMETLRKEREEAVSRA